MNPFLLREYDIEVPLSIKVLLDLDNSKNIVVGNIMVLHEKIEDSTINFLAPIIFNFDNQTMGQVILDGAKYLDYSLAEPISNYIRES